MLCSQKLTTQPVLHPTSYLLFYTNNPDPAVTVSNGLFMSHVVVAVSSAVRWNIFVVSV